MKTILASIAALAAVTTVASAGGHRHHHYGYASSYNFVRYAPVYVQPAYTCKVVYHHGHAHRTCYKVYSNSYGH